MSAADAALRPYTTEVAEEWIDYNGHLSEAYYVLVFGFTTDRIMVDLGLDADYRAATGCSLYTVEAHVRYLREVPRGATLQVTPRVVASGAKKLHLAYEMHVGGELVATEEIMALHVDGSGAAPFPAAIAERIEALPAAVPEWSGRRIGA
ncbi:thioesterase family protein [Zhihengliuella salsuginis]|uniref:4-hydroxybenzoyl-CoA thioesterase n=1 Tax=Zhihengliuella salsuginis TaxID=578222 RepID=A0ABQ3GC42_9MICC|nr:thioesterase family protein [Zhihengliuella salsuginis]GHC98995.1 4-hydroxybenzoyl-CoA thioesterase [Zhihengliuella salsuginis]